MGQWGNGAMGQWGNVESPCMSLEALSLSALTLGFLHGLGADHLMAIAALSVAGPVDRRQARVVRTAVGFACGHTLVLGAGVAAAVAFGLVLPAAVSSGAERVGGAILVTLGMAGCWSVISGRAYSHIHSDAAGRAHWHLHLGGQRAHAGGHAHSFVPTAMGAVFAISSLRALMLLQPFGAGAGTLALPALLLLIALFGLGILLSMSIFGVLLARVLSIRAVEQFGQMAAGLVAIASIGLGMYWILT